MELEGKDSNEKIIVDANKIISKYRNKKYRLLFCHEKNRGIPKKLGLTVHTFYRFSQAV